MKLVEQLYPEITCTIVCAASINILQDKRPVNEASQLAKTHEYRQVEAERVAKQVSDMVM